MRCLWSRREPPLNHAGTLISGFQPPKICKINFCCLNYSTSDILLQCPEWTKTLVSHVFMHMSKKMWQDEDYVCFCSPIDDSPPGCSVPGILQARTLEWVAISFSNAWKGKVKVKSLSCIWLLMTPWTVVHQAPLSMGFSRQEYWSGVPWCLNKKYYILNDIQEIFIQ